MKLDTLDLKASLAAVIHEKNPKFDVKLAPSIILGTPAVNSDGVSNTSMKIYVDSDTAYGGLSLKYNRLDLTKLLSSFGSTTKVPYIKVFYPQGTVVKLSDIIAQLRAIFNIQLALGTGYEDISDATITMPTKGGYVDVPVTVPANSLRCIPGSTLVLRFINNGASLNSTLAVRNINPIVGLNAAGTLNLPTSNNIPAINVTGTVKELPALKFRYMNFSDIIGGLTGDAIFDSVRVTANNWDHSIKQTIFDALNARLATLGFPLIVNRKIGSAVASAAGYNQDTQAASAAVEFYTTTVRKTTASLPAQLVDPNYTYCMVITLAQGGMLETSSCYAHDYFLQFK